MGALPSPAPVATPTPAPSLIVGVWETRDYVEADLGFGYHWYFVRQTFNANGTGTEEWIWEADNSWILPISFTWTSENGTATIRAQLEGGTILEYSIS